MEPRVYLVLGLWEGADFVPLHRTRDQELIEATASRILLELNTPVEGNARSRLRRSESERLRALFAYYGIATDPAERVVV